MTIDASFFDKRRYPVASATEGYGEWAATYEATVAVGLDEPLLERLASLDFTGVDAAVDLACGTGRTGRWLKQRGIAAIDGVDATPEMLAIAREKGIYRSLAVADVGATGLRSKAYQLAIMSLADEHLPDMSPAYREAARLLGPDGRFILIGYHPFFLMNGLITHFHRAGGEAVTVRSFVHMLSDHWRAGSAAGLRLSAFDECVIDEGWLRAKPKWRPYLNWPVSFALVWEGA
jgi:SAM-dependent methyltransferase